MRSAQTGDHLRGQVKKRGRPKVILPCAHCKKPMGTRELWLHQSKCSKRQKAIRREAMERKIK
jgi:hypothetical protein